TNPTTLKSFLGLTNYYRKFIRHFSRIAAPLTNLTKKNTPFHWAAQHETAFQTLKDELVKAPCLHAPDFKKPFILQTDTSGQGLGAVLVQKFDTEEHPVAYISRQLNSAEANYSGPELECLAVVWAVKEFEHFLIDAPFTIVTDNIALTWLPSKNFTNARMRRWALILSQFTFTVIHRKGRNNANADALSRN